MTSRLILALVGLMLGAAGCGGRWGAAQRAPGSALQVSVGRVSGPQLGELERVGIRELWVEAGLLDWDGSRPRIKSQIELEPPRRLSCTLVVRGRAPAQIEDTTVDELHRELADLVVAAEGKGLFAVGIHLELAGLEPSKAMGEVFRGLRKKLDSQVLLSATLPREVIELSEAKELVRGLDFVVSMLYGQRPEEAEVPRRWDFQQVEVGTRGLERLGKPYLVGVSILGSTAQLDRGGRVLATTTEVGLRELVAARGLAVEHGFTLEGIDRQVYSFRADQPVRLGPLAVAAGQRLRLVRSSTPHIEELTRLFGAWNLPNRLGELYIRMPAPAEATGLAIENLVNALGPSPTMPDPEVTVESLTPGRRALRLRIRLENRAPEPTDLGFVDHNFVELVATDAFWGDIDAGEFSRFDLLKPDRKGELRRSLQAPTVLRFYVPLLEAGQSFQSGVVELQPTDIDPRILVGANFLVPSGRSASFGPREWRLGAGR